MSVGMCLSVPKDLANCCTDMILFYSKASYKSWEGLKLFQRRVTPPPKEIIPEKLTKKYKVAMNDLANSQKYMVFLYSVASHGSWEGLQLFWGEITSTRPSKYFFVNS